MHFGLILLCLGIILAIVPLNNAAGWTPTVRTIAVIACLLPAEALFLAARHFSNKGVIEAVRLKHSRDVDVALKLHLYGPRFLARVTALTSIGMFMIILGIALLSGESGSLGFADAIACILPGGGLLSVGLLARRRFVRIASKIE